MNARRIAKISVSQFPPNTQKVIKMGVAPWSHRTKNDKIKQEPPPARQRKKKRQWVSSGWDDYDLRCINICVNLSFFVVYEYLSWSVGPWNFHVTCGWDFSSSVCGNVMIIGWTNRCAAGPGIYLNRYFLSFICTTCRRNTKEKKKTISKSKWRPFINFPWASLFDIPGETPHLLMTIFLSQFAFSDNKTSESQMPH